MVSAVPAGLVIARDEVFGMTRPCEATIATTIGVVRLPGSPPTECLSTTIGASQASRSPASIIAWVRLTVSPRSSGRAEQAVRKAERWTSV